MTKATGTTSRKKKPDEKAELQRIVNHLESKVIVLSNQISDLEKNYQKILNSKSTYDPRPRLETLETRLDWFREEFQQFRTLYQSVSRPVHEAIDMLDKIKKFLKSELNFNPAKENK